MRNIQSYVMLCSWVVLLWCSGCEASDDNPVALASGEWAVTVTVTTWDEFLLPIPLTGTTTITLSAADRTLHALLEDGRTSFSFKDLPLQAYLASARKDRYYSAQSRPMGSPPWGVLNIPLPLYRTPDPKSRIDSIRCVTNTTVPRILLRLFTQQILPKGGIRRAVIFAGLSPNVSPRYGTYVSTTEVYQEEGVSYFQTEDVYAAMRAGGIAPGMKVYLTARLMSGATTTWLDETTGITMYANLEASSNALATFVMP